MLEQEQEQQKSTTRAHIGFAAFISAFFFLMGPMTETIVVLGDNPHIPFYIYTMVLWLVSTALTFNIAVNWEKRTQAKNYQWTLGSVVAFVLMYMTATVF